MIFDYPNRKAERRHGPAGYASYESYRPWLRDEFDFRCVYCLKREQWGQVTGEFEIDHFEPQAVQPQRRLDYLNLVYACRRCNAVKLDQSIADPLLVLSSVSAVVLPDGSLQSNDAESRRLIRQIDLDSLKLRKWRVMWMRIVTLAEKLDPDLFAQLVGFPEDPPKLNRLRPAQNSRKSGLKESWFAKRERGEVFAL